MERDDETGLQLHGVRFYAPWLGRWCSSDPIGMGGGMNRLVYAANGPIGMQDLDGLAPQPNRTRKPIITGPFSGKRRTKHETLRPLGGTSRFDSHGQPTFPAGKPPPVVAEPTRSSSPAIEVRAVGSPEDAPTIRFDQLDIRQRRQVAAKYRLTQEVQARLDKGGSITTGPSVGVEVPSIPWKRDSNGVRSTLPKLILNVDYATMAIIHGSSPEESSTHGTGPTIGDHEEGHHDFNTGFYAPESLSRFVTEGLLVQSPLNQEYVTLDAPGFPTSVNAPSLKQLSAFLDDDLTALSQHILEAASYASQLEHHDATSPADETPYGIVNGQLVIVDEPPELPNYKSGQPQRQP